MKIKAIFRDLAIQRKLLLITFTICAAVLVLALTAIFLFQFINFRSSFKRDTATLADIIANNCTAALAFDDRKAASEIIASLTAKPTVLYACLVDPTQESVAEFGNPAASGPLSQYPVSHEFRFHKGALLYSQIVVLDGKNIGALYLCMDYRSVLDELLRFYGLITVLVLAGSVVIALLLSHGLGRIITRPMLELAGTARLVGEKNDYSVRSTVADSRDEVGRLAAAFNRMLARIQQQDAALNLSQQKLESLVNSINGIVWERLPTSSEFTFVSQQSQSLLGYLPESWLNDPKFWGRIVHPDDLEKASSFCQEAIARRLPYHHEYRILSADRRLFWIRESGTIILDPGGNPAILRGIFQDITAQKHAAEELKTLNRRLLEISRQAGMAEVATGVLHNVGNVLNSVNVSATLLSDQITNSQCENLHRVAGLLKENLGDVSRYLTTDPKGRLVPEFIIKVSEAISNERGRWLGEVESLKRSVEHIKEIVAMQQSFARISGVIETLDIKDLVEDAVQINASGLLHEGVDIVRRYGPVPPVLVDKHKVMQILINLISNAKYALAANPPSCRLLTLHIRPGRPTCVQIAVQDNGAGIAPDNLTRIFSLGFTTRKDGHGFGLHSGALAARELGGSLVAQSDGPGTGATFTLELPAVKDPKP
jgi:PAS domain S-box-containing protein